MEDDIVLKLLHTADWHLGRRFRSFGEEQEKRLTRARLEVLDRIFGLAERYAVDVVLCAGDLFDDHNPSRDWWEPVAEKLSSRRWKDRPVFLLPGNHDPLTVDSVWAPSHPFRAAVPAFVQVVDQPLVEVPLAGGQAVLHAVPCLSKAGQKDPTESIPQRVAGDERVRIGLVHGSTYDVDNRLTNFPIAQDAAVARGLDYLAIGDTHGFRFVPPDREHPPTIYPGAPEATAFDEKDPGNVAVVFLSRQRRATVRKERVARWTWEEREITTLADLRVLARRTDLGERVLRLKVEMRVSAPDYQEAERLLEDLSGNAARQARVGVLELDRDGLELDTASIEQHCEDLPDILRSTVRRLKLAAEDPDKRAAAERALFHLYRVSRRKTG
ncbi:MAG: DNA repair exonuclease [Deltaproteobacteria bacterium]|nr:DNA repair exonuclease [Deltaproteobacteria bacterium]